MKQRSYRIFWFTHNLGFVTFWVGTIFHGPQFIYWFMVPGGLYVIERLYRVKRGNHEIYLKQVKWIAPYVRAGAGAAPRDARRRSVLCLEFCPKDKAMLPFVEGQYIYMNCPALSTSDVRGARARARLLSACPLPARSGTRSRSRRRAATWTAKTSSRCTSA